MKLGSISLGVVACVGASIWICLPRAVTAHDPAVPREHPAEARAEPVRSSAQDRDRVDERAAAAVGDVPALELREVVALTPREPVDAAQLERWIADLEDDATPWNAVIAVEHLHAAWPEAERPLAAALDSRDWQQAQLAAYVLAGRKSVIRSSRLAEVLVDGLRSDDLPSPRSARPLWADEHARVHTRVRNGSRAAEWLFDHPDLSRNALEAAVDLPDLQRQLAVASLLAIDGASAWSDRACALLVEHLADNSIAQDAALAFDVLGSVGPRALVHIDRAWPGSDGQQHRLLARLLNEIAPSDSRSSESETDDSYGVLYGMTRPYPREALVERWYGDE